MSASFDSTPRSALRKAPDADIHPTTHAAASSLSSASAADAVLSGKEVELTIRIPKKLRKQVKKVARESELSIDQIATIALAAEVQRRSK
jgi:predicted HicB family RNase H-like nuclease